MYFWGKPLIRMVWRNDVLTGDYISELHLEDEIKIVRIPAEDILLYSAENPNIKFDDILIRYLYDYTTLSFEMDYIL